MTEKAKKAVQARSYIVLRQTPGSGPTPPNVASSTPPKPDSWTPVGEPVDAANDQAAIKLATATGEKFGTFVAIPARSFRPRTRAIKTVERDEWS